MSANALIPSPNRTAHARLTGALPGIVMVLAATLGLLAVAPSADAGKCDRSRRSGVSFSIGVGHHSDRGHIGFRYSHRDHDRRGYHRGHYERRSHGHVRVHDRHYRPHHRDHRRHYDRDYRRHDRGWKHHDRRSRHHYDRGHHRDRYDYRDRRAHDYQKHHPTGRSGYWKKVWCPPVYRTVYDPCGTARKICVRRGYYKNVYVRINVDRCD